MRELYVYYRIDAANAAAARRAVQAMQERLRRDHAGLVARLLTRTGEGSSAQTWMETYAVPGATGGVDPGLEAAIDEAAAHWQQLLDGPRHVEPFIADR